MKRTLAAKTNNKTGEKVTIKGWVDTVRSHGKVIFVDLRDISGIVQVVFDPEFEQAYQEAQNLRPEWVVEIEGEVSERPENMINKDLETGEIEIKAEEIKTLSKAETPPFDIYGDGYEISEKKRLKYRYLDLRRSRLKKNLKKRQEIIQSARDFLKERGFWEISTPVLTKSTPEGARDFVVPSRIHPGKFYALPQSPQQYKQLLMVAGFEKYFQVPHIFRDEDLRADRMFESTQIDIEMSFVKEKDIRNLVEKMVTKITEQVLGKEIQEKPFPVLTYGEAMEKFNRDDPDLREDLPAGRQVNDEIMAYAWIVDFPMFEEKEDGSLGACHHPFTAIKEEHLEKLRETQQASDKNEIATQIQAQQYDLVLNGHEIFGGSIREHRPEILKRVFDVLGHNEKEIQEKFGHLLEAFKYGVPPHGGIAAGLDRWIQVLLGEKSIREVFPFPTTSSGRTSVMDAPSKLSKEQLKELHLKIIKEED